LTLSQIGGIQTLYILIAITIIIIVFLIIFTVIKTNRNSMSIEAQIDRCQKLASGIGLDE